MDCLHLRTGGDVDFYIMDANGSGEWQLLDFQVHESDGSLDGLRIVSGSDRELLRRISVWD
jgi:hypothetical protein